MGTCGNQEFLNLNKCLTQKFEDVVMNRNHKEALCNALKQVVNCQNTNPKCQHEYNGLAHVFASTPGLEAVSEENDLDCLKDFIRYNTQVLASGSSRIVVPVNFILLLFMCILRIQSF